MIYNHIHFCIFKSGLKNNGLDVRNDLFGVTERVFLFVCFNLSPVWEEREKNDKYTQSITYNLFKIP